jgi:GTP pyrophosphokinase
MTFDQFITSIPHEFSSEEKSLLERAFEFAKIAHTGKVRASGDPYVTHPISAAIILGQIFPDPDSLAATLLHDTTEDTEVTTEHIRAEFGNKITELVDGVTKLGKVRLGATYQPQYLENLRKLFVATSQDVRVMLIKLADRIHNMQTIQFLPKDKQARIAKESLEIYAPIAARLGIGVWQGELDLQK